MYRRPFTVALAFFLIGAFALSPRAQEKSDLANFRQLHNELREQMANDLVAASTYLESKIDAEPDSEDLNVLRQSLATRLASEGNFKAANDQFDKLLDFQLERSDQLRNQYGVWMTIQSMRELADESGNSDAMNSAVERALAKLENVNADLMPRSQLAVLRARELASDNQDDEAKKMVNGYVVKLESINESKQATSETMQALVGMLRSMTDAGEDNELWLDDSIDKLADTVTLAIKKYPESLPLQSSYAEVQLLKITRWNQDDPDATNRNIEAVLNTLNRFSSKNASVRATAKRIELHKMQMSAAKPKESLVGKPAPEWDIDAWVNTIAMERDDLKGKVVLLDFWAMWCGPCIATFPHLKEWREEFGDETFEIVGVTTYYNFRWDDDKERASRSSDEVSPADERQTIASFLDHHKLKHPVIVTPEGSQMNSNYGVRGIPHVVLIDKEGVVQFIKTGAGDAAAKEIHAKIKTLLEG